MTETGVPPVIAIEISSNSSFLLSVRVSKWRRYVEAHRKELSDASDSYDSLLVLTCFAALFLHLLCAGASSGSPVRLSRFGAIITIR